jgi:hypothetical protein
MIPFLPKSQTQNHNTHTHTCCLLPLLQALLPPFPSVLGSLVKAAWQSWRELLTRLTRSEIRHWVRSSASSRTAWKVLKDPRCVWVAWCVCVWGGVLHVFMPA